MNEIEFTQYINEFIDFIKNQNKDKEITSTLFSKEITQIKFEEFLMNVNIEITTDAIRQFNNYRKDTLKYLRTKEELSSLKLEGNPYLDYSSENWIMLDGLFSLDALESIVKVIKKQRG